MSTNVIEISASAPTETDGRTDNEKAVEDKAGVKGQTALDKVFGRVQKHATDIFLNKKQFGKYLHLGEESYAFTQLWMEYGGTRSEAFNRIKERLYDAGLDSTSIRVADWVAVFQLACLVTKVGTVDEMPAEFVGGHAYRNVVALKIGIDTDGTYAKFKTGWADFVVESLRTGLNGKGLDRAIEQQKESVKQLVRSNKTAGMTDDQLKQFQNQEASQVRDKQIRAIKSSLESVRDNMINADMSQEQLLCELVSRGMIAAPAPQTIVPETAEDFAKFAATLDDTKAGLLAKAMTDRGDYKAIMVMAGMLTGWLKAQASLQPQKAIA